MQLKEFTTAIQEQTQIYSANKIMQMANHIYKANYVAPAYTTIRFDIACVRDNSCFTRHLNMILRLTSDHPSFRPNLKTPSTGHTVRLCDFWFGNGEILFSDYGCNPDAQLSTIIADAQNHIIMIRLPSHSPSGAGLTEPGAVAGNGGDLRDPQGVKVPCRRCQAPSAGY